jgi:hypothetical protein
LRVLIRVTFLIVDGLVTAFAKLPYTGVLDSSHRGIFLGNSKGNVYLIDLGQPSKVAQKIKVAKVFKTNPVSQALHFSRRSKDGDILFVGGEMSDTILYLVPPLS